MNSYAQTKSVQMQQMIENELGELSPLEKKVLESIRSETLLSPTFMQEMEPLTRFPHRLADDVAAVVGSWRFFLFIMFFLISWISINLLFRPFEPYPSIVMAVIGATFASLGALQGPLLMMSQRRQRRLDQMQIYHDYQINLKAELEIRHLTRKMEEMLAMLHTGKISHE